MASSRQEARSRVGVRLDLYVGSAFYSIWSVHMAYLGVRHYLADLTLAEALHTRGERVAFVWITLVCSVLSGAITLCASSLREFITSELQPSTRILLMPTLSKVNDESTAGEGLSHASKVNFSGSELNHEPTSTAFHTFNLPNQPQRPSFTVHHTTQPTPTITTLLQPLSSQPSPKDHRSRRYAYGVERPSRCSGTWNIPRQQCAY